MMKWEQLLSNKRLGQENEPHRADDRTEFQRDYDRIIFSAPFRRLQNKTQVFPLPRSIFVHNRLTHSLEVSSVGRSLGNDVARQLIAIHPHLSNTYLSELGSIVSTACLAHDLGNPPFGHSGERAIATYFSEGNGKFLQHYTCKDTGDTLSPKQWEDLIHFDGNANAFRLLTHHFLGRRPGGFVMTYSTLASIVKYPYTSDLAGNKRKFGFFRDEEEIYCRIARELGIMPIETADGAKRFARYPLVYLVEAADDICYQIMDIEDAHKLKILTTEETKNLLFNFFDEEKKIYIHRRLSQLEDINEQIVYLRSSAINCLENECVKVFIQYEKEILEGNFQGSLIQHISSIPYKAYKTCEEIAWQKIYHCKEVVDIEIAGFQVILELLDMMIHAVIHPEKAFSELLVNRVSHQYDIKAPTLYGRIMAVLDYISGMTDVFALDLYRKTKGMSISNL